MCPAGIVANPVCAEGTLMLELCLVKTTELPLSFQTPFHHGRQESREGPTEIQITDEPPCGGIRSLDMFLLSANHVPPREK